MRIIFENITEDDGLQLIQRFNCEWKVGLRAFLYYGILPPQVGVGGDGTWGGRVLI